MAYIVQSNYFIRYFGGVYSTMSNARESIVQFFKENSTIKFYAEQDDYSYIFTTLDNQSYWIEIVACVVDEL